MEDCKQIHLDNYTLGCSTHDRTWGECQSERIRFLGLQLGEATSALKYAKDAISSAWAALGDNMESQALGGKGIEKPYAYQVQSELRAAGERISVVLTKVEKRLDGAAHNIITEKGNRIYCSCEIGKDHS